MILPILAYGCPALRQETQPVSGGEPQLKQLIRNMWETMENANGCGLAAPQTGQLLNLFIVDSRTTYEYLDENGRSAYFDKGDQGIRETFINAVVLSCSDREWEDEEGCLSIPGISRKVTRPWQITVEYLDATLKKQARTFTGTTARMIQHEYDHTQGVLFPDRISPLSRKLLRGKLERIRKGKVRPPYPMKFQ